jgi:hypothetical protein
MSPPISRIIEGKKLMWDGRIYPTRDAAAAARAGYEHVGFETWEGEEAGAFLVYTRRVAGPAAVDKSP